MPIESGSTIEDLDNLWPLSSDPLLEGDNHLRLIKAVLKAQFPGVGGLGFATPITATEAELNFLSGVTSNVQEQLDALELDFQSTLYAPAGTVMIFFQPSVPLGWTQLTANNDSMLRIVSGAGGGGGGTVSPISFNFSHTHTTQSHALTVLEMPGHGHKIGYERGTSRGSPDNPPGIAVQSQTAEPDTFSGITGGGAAHSHGNTGSSAPAFTPKYINVITGVKD